MGGARGEVHQILGAFHPGDAVGNEARAIQAHLRRDGYASEVFAGWIDPRLADQARPLSEYPRRTGAVTLLHFAAGSPANRMAFHAAHRLVCIYHNVTPARFFRGLSAEHVRLSHQGRRELAALAGRAELALGVSEFNRRELEQAGFRRTGVLPYVFDFSEYRQPPSAVVRRLYRDRLTNLLFVGRLVPNKRIEDLIRVLAEYQRCYDRRSRLFLVGDDRAIATYRHRLAELAAALGVESVVFAGHVEHDELLAYYSQAQVFLCLSEHEGFGVPLVEAMHLGVPVIAYDAGAVAETLRGGGILLKDKQAEMVAGIVWQVVSDPEFRRAVLATQERAMAELLRIDYGALIMERLDPVLGSGAA